MTCDEFNEKYCLYIENRFRGCELHNTEALKYLDKEFQEFIKIPGFKFQQIKSKWNWFCFYCDNIPKEKVEHIENNLKRIYETS